jgi:hypothetical protein
MGAMSNLGGGSKGMWTRLAQNVQDAAPKA